MNLVKSACLVPYRETEEGVVVLLGKRSYFNHEQKRPMSFPGEWSFLGGKAEPEDPDLEHTAKRELGEEIGYRGRFFGVEHFVDVRTRLGSTVYDIAVYLAQLESDPEFDIPQNGEIIDLDWDDPTEWARHLTSKQFEAEQRRAIEDHELNHPRYGDHAITRRQVSTQMISALEALTYRFC